MRALVGWLVKLVLPLKNSLGMALILRCALLRMSRRRFLLV
ncbi:hypothetical protein LINPERPRIM_LOCUS7013 [Linum perenne]